MFRVTNTDGHAISTKIEFVDDKGDSHSVRGVTRLELELLPEEKVRMTMNIIASHFDLSVFPEQVNVCKEENTE